MEFRILGPLEAHRGDARVAITGRHRPRLLAALLLEPARVVTIHRLAEVLWGEAPPDTARRQVQNAMATLRRELGDGVVEPTSGGYRLADGHTVDTETFADLRRQARGARRGDDARHALDLLRQALNLWRGHALAGMSGGALRAAARRLDEERLSATEDRIDLELELGTAGEVLEELTTLVETHPLRQRLVGQLMRTFHETGWASEAIKLYRDLRQRLADELGLDPEPRLTRLYGDLLRANTSGPLTETPTTPVPRQLPADTATFTGRTEHLAALDDLLDGGRETAVVSAIAGMGGAGKTALAVHWGHKVRDRFPDGQLYINLRGWDTAEPVAPLDALTRFLVALGQSSSTIPSTVEAAAALFRSMLSDRRMLLVLDNARDAAQVCPLLPSGGGNFSLVTSRDSLADLAHDYDATSVRLDTLSHDDSVGLLRRIVGDRRVDAEFDAAERLADLCGRLPLVLRITAANLASHDEMGLAQYVAQLSGPERLNRLAVEGDPAAAASPMFDVSFSALIPADQRLLATLSLIPGDDFCDDLVASMIDRNPTETASALGRLTSAHLVENYRPARYRLHDLVREYALRQARRVMAEEGRHAARSRFIHWYFHNRNQLRPEEGANVIAALKTWLGEPDTWRLAVSLSGFRSAEFQSSELLRLAQDELPMARESGDTQGIALLCVTVATLLSYTGDRASAITYAQEAVNVAPEDPDGHFHANLAILLLQVGRYADAEPVLRTALAAATTNGNQRLIQSCTSMLANTLRIRGDWDEAEKLLLPLASPKNELPSRIGALLHLAETLGDRGRESEVSPVLDEALAIASNSPDIRHKALTLIIRAAHLDRIGSAGLAHQDLTEALNLAEQGERAVLTYDVRLVRAELLSNSGKQDEATSELDLLPHNDSDPALTAELSRLRCLVHTRRRDFVRAVEFGQRAREIYGAMRYPLRLARTLELLSDAYNGAGDSIRAKECHGAAQKVFLNLGLAVTEAQTED